MTGLFLFFVIGLWFFITVWLSGRATAKLPDTKWRAHLRFLMFSALLPLPVIDEIVGGWQFRKLCEENSMIQFDRATAAGRTVYLADPAYVDIEKAWVRIVMKPWRYIDVATKETVVNFNVFSASGGRFIRALGISEGGVPLTFKGYCEVSPLINKAKLFREIGIIQIY